MISLDSIQRSEIRNHYELATVFYRLLWGVHIHHGLWEGDETPKQAQRQLIEHLVGRADIRTGSKILDVGCGMGGSSIHLAKHLDCEVTGITLSRVQRRWAANSAFFCGVGRRTTFLLQNAEQVEFPDASFDVVWSIECTEHLFDKPAFFERAARFLRPGGRVAICAWLAGDEPHTADTVKQVEAVCDAFLCPSLGTEADYTAWLTDAGLEMRSVTDLTPKVARTWEICQHLVRQSGIGLLAKPFGRNMTDFVQNFETLLQAYRSGAMKYGSFVATRAS